MCLLLSNLLRYANSTPTKLTEVIGSHAHLTYKLGVKALIVSRAGLSNFYRIKLS